MGMVVVNAFTCSTTWQDYINRVFLESGFVSKAAIFSLIPKQGCWAKSPNFSLNVSQMAYIVDAFENSRKHRLQGLEINNRLFTLTRITDKRILVARETKTGYGCVIYKCNKCVIIGLYEAGNHPGSCYTTVVKTGDYLVENGL